MVPAAGVGSMAWLMPAAEDNESVLRSKQRAILHQIKVITQRLQRAESHVSHKSLNGTASDVIIKAEAAAAAAAPGLRSANQRSSPCKQEHAQHVSAHVPSSQPHLDDSPVELSHQHHQAVPTSRRRSSSTHAPGTAAVGRLSPQRHVLSEQQQQQQQHPQRSQQQQEPMRPKHSYASCSPGSLKRKAEATDIDHAAPSGASADGDESRPLGVQEGGGRRESTGRGSGSSKASGVSRKAPRSSSLGSGSGEVRGSGGKVSGADDEVPGSNGKVSGCSDDKVSGSSAKPPGSSSNIVSGSSGKVPGSSSSGSGSGRVLGTPSAPCPATSAADPLHVPPSSLHQPPGAPAPPPASLPAAQPELTGQITAANADSLANPQPPLDCSTHSHGPHPEAAASVPSTSQLRHFPHASPSVQLSPPAPELSFLPSSSTQNPDPAEAAAWQLHLQQPVLHSRDESVSERRVLSTTTLADSCGASAAGAQMSEVVVAGTPLRGLGSSSWGEDEGAAGSVAHRHCVVAGTPPPIALNPLPEGAEGGAGGRNGPAAADAVRQPSGRSLGNGAVECQLMGRALSQRSGDPAAAAGEQARLQLDGAQHGDHHHQQQQQQEQQLHMLHMLEAEGLRQLEPEVELVPATPTSPPQSPRASFQPGSRLGVSPPAAPFPPESCLGPTPEPDLDIHMPGHSPPQPQPQLLAASIPELHPAAGYVPGAAGLLQPGLIPALQGKELPQAPPRELHMPGLVRAAWACTPVCPSCKQGAGARTLSCLLLQLPPDGPAADSLGRGNAAAPSPSPLAPPTTIPQGISSSSSSSSGSHRLLLLSSGPPGPPDLPPSPHLLADMRLRLDPGVGLLLDQGALNLRSSLSVHQHVCGSGGGCVLITARGVWQLDSGSSGPAGGGGDSVAGRGAAAAVGRQPAVGTRSIFAAARQRRGSSFGRGGASEQAPARGGVEVCTWCPRTGAWGVAQHLEGPVTALCVLLVQLQGRGLVLAAGQGGQVHVWSWEEAEQRAVAGPGSSQGLGPEGCSGCNWAAAQQPTRSFSLPPATYRGLAVNEVLELRLLSGGGSSTSAGPSCLILGCCSEGTVVVWDVLRQELLSAVHLPMCRLSCLQPLPGQLLAVATGAAARMQTEGGRGEGGVRFSWEGTAREHSASGALQQQQQQQPGAHWPLLLLAKVVESSASHLLVGAAAAGQARARCPGPSGGGCCRGSSAGQVVLVKLWEDRAQVCLGPDLSRLTPMAHCSGGDELQQQQQQQCCPCMAVSAGCGVPRDAITCMAAVGRGWFVLGTASGQVLVWDAATGGLAAALDCSAAGAAVGTVDLTLVGDEGLPGAGSGAGEGEQLVVVAGVGEVAVVWKLRLQQATFPGTG